MIFANNPDQCPSISNKKRSLQCPSAKIFPTLTGYMRDPSQASEKDLVGKGIHIVSNYAGHYVTGIKTVLSDMTTREVYPSCVFDNYIALATAGIPPSNTLIIPFDPFRQFIFFSQLGSDD